MKYRKKPVVVETYQWGVLCHSVNKLDGDRQWVMRENCIPVMFLTRKRAREWIQEKYGYISKRIDLKREPHGWRIPIPIRLKISCQGIPIIKHTRG